MIYLILNLIEKIIRAIYNQPTKQTITISIKLKLCIEIHLPMSKKLMKIELKNTI
jgi:hypothetical protein